MKFISHRGNIIGPDFKKENTPTYIDEAIQSEYDVEIDIWGYRKSLWLGHDNPTYKIEIDWILARSSFLWIHCKNIQAIEILTKKHNNDVNYFFHQNDEYTITSKQYIWAHTKVEPTPLSICVLPESYNYQIKDLTKCIGICSDYIKTYKHEHEHEMCVSN